MTEFICRDIRKRVRDEFIILLLAVDAVWVVGKKINLSHITVVPQGHHMPYLVINLLENPNEGAPSVNDTTDG